VGRVPNGKCARAEVRFGRYSDLAIDRGQWRKSQGEPSFAKTHLDDRVAPFAVICQPTIGWLKSTLTGNST
jgi:hypothetical protein